MYDKIASMQKIVDSGMNMHQWFVPKNIAEFSTLVYGMRQCSIRTDHAAKTKDMPFYTVNVNDPNRSIWLDIMTIWHDAQHNGYKLIISDGIKYDPVQIYNMTVKFEINGDFYFEASEEKVPLRHMYRYPLLSAAGNVSNEIQEWMICSDLPGLNRLDLRRDLQEIYTCGIFNRWLELTKYPVPVGIRQQHIAFWQI